MIANIINTVKCSQTSEVKTAGQVQDNTDNNSQTFEEYLIYGETNENETANINAEIPANEQSESLPGDTAAQSGSGQIEDGNPDEDENKKKQDLMVKGNTNFQCNFILICQDNTSIKSSECAPATVSAETAGNDTAVGEFYKSDNSQLNQSINVNTGQGISEAERNISAAEVNTAEVINQATVRNNNAESKIQSDPTNSAQPAKVIQGNTVLIQNEETELNTVETALSQNINIPENEKFEIKVNKNNNEIPIPSESTFENTYINISAKNEIDNSVNKVLSDQKPQIINSTDTETQKSEIRESSLENITEKLLFNKPSESGTPVSETANTKPDNVIPKQSERYKQDNNLSGENEGKGVFSSISNVKKSEKSEINNSDKNVEMDFRNNLSFINNKVTGNPEISKDIEGRKLIGQIADFISEMSKNDEKSITMDLFPEQLGKLKVELKYNGGKLFVKIEADTDTVKEILTGRLDDLKNAFTQKNIDLGSLDINSGNNPGSQLSENSGHQSFNSNENENRYHNSRQDDKDSLYDNQIQYFRNNDLLNYLI